MTPPLLDSIPPDLPRSRPLLRLTFRVQWDGAQGAYLLRSPTETIKLNPSAGEILSRCDGTRELDEIIDELEDLFSTSAVAADVYRFIDHARQRGWLD